MAALAATLALQLAACRGELPARVDFRRQVLPILSDRCFHCHGPDSANRQADLRLDIRDAALGRKGVLVPGAPGASELVRRINSGDADERMPPTSSKLSLSTADAAVLTRWVAEGAEYRPHWAFEPLPDSVSPPADDATGRSADGSTIDRFIESRLATEGVSPAPAADRETWLRRVSLTLTGLPPTVAEQDDFLRDVTAEATARAKVVDRLLASPRFGERMAVDWLDLVRYADSFGYQSDADMEVWPYRDWVVDAFNGNLPFDRFAAAQLAGDLLPQATRDDRLATAFNRLHRMTGEGGSVPEEFRHEYVADRVNTFGTAFLGLTLECCRCHDHKFDPVATREYYSLAAFFNSIDEWGTYDSSAFRATPTLDLPTGEQAKAIDELRRKSALAEAFLQSTRAAALRRIRESSASADAAKPAADSTAIYHFDALLANNGLADETKAGHGTTSAANRLVDGRFGMALSFTGDDGAKLPTGLPGLDRAQPWSIAFWMRRPAALRTCLILHHSAGTDTGFHGLEIGLEDERLRLALVRFWPGNALAVVTAAALPADRWVHVGLAYDGSSRATDVRLFVDGLPAAAAIVRDGLSRDLWVNGADLTAGERFRTVGFKGGALDDLHVFDRPLPDVEFQQLAGRAEGETANAGGVRSSAAFIIRAEQAPEVVAARTSLRQARTEQFAAESYVREIMTMRELPSPRASRVLARGQYDAPVGDPAPRATPAALPPFPANQPRDRLGLARWLTDRRHPLAARVFVNRVWQLFFDQGLVATPENFGLQGAPPTHPELLDWLARDFVDHGWDVKRLCRALASTQAFGRSSVATAQAIDRDPANILLARGPRHRLAAEMLRDAALLAGGLLVERRGGPPVRPPLPAGQWKEFNNFLPEYVADTGDGRHRRSLYTFWRRTSPPPNMLAFDAAGRESCVVRRSTTMTPLQPLVLLNDPQFVEAAVGLAEQMLRATGDDAARLTWAFRTATSRRPRPAELAELLALWRRIETAPADALPPADAAARRRTAATVGAQAIMNLDAAVMAR